jgi:uncharacterized membrane protein YtjA (UPF0391 family)
MGISVGQVAGMSYGYGRMSYGKASGRLTAINGHFADTSFPPAQCGSRSPGANMLYYAAVFLVIALIAAFFGFGGIAVGAASIAKILFVIFLIVAAVTFLMSLGRRT